MRDLKGDAANEFTVGAEPRWKAPCTSLSSKQGESQHQWLLPCGNVIIFSLGNTDVVTVRLALLLCNPAVQPTAECKIWQLDSLASTCFHSDHKHHAVQHWDLPQNGTKNSIQVQDHHLLCTFKNLSSLNAEFPVILMLYNFHQHIIPDPAVAFLVQIVTTEKNGNNSLIIFPLFHRKALWLLKFILDFMGHQALFVEHFFAKRENNDRHYLCVVCQLVNTGVNGLATSSLLALQQDRSCQGSPRAMKPIFLELHLKDKYRYLLSCLRKSELLIALQESADRFLLFLAAYMPKHFSVTVP